MAEEEPPTKKIKTGWEDLTLNCSLALMKDDEGRHLADIAKDPITTLQGIGKVAKELLDHLHIHTVEQLATYKFFLIARGIKTLAEVEKKGDRPSDSVMNINKAIDKADESKSFQEMVESPLSILQGLSEEADKLFNKLGVKSVGDLAEFKFCRWAEAFVDLSKYEEVMSAEERKKARELKKLE